MRIEKISIFSSQFAIFFIYLSIYIFKFSLFRALPKILKKRKCLLGLARRSGISLFEID